jgi:integrase
MITFKPVVYAHQRRTDGSYNVKIRVTYKRVSRNLATTLTAGAGDLTRSLKLRQGEVLRKADALIGEMRGAVTGLSPFLIEDMDIDGVVAYIKRQLARDDFALDFFEWADSFLACKGDKTRQGYEASLRALERYLGGRELDINAFSVAMLREFAEWLESEPRTRWDAKSGEWVRGTAATKWPAATHLMRLAHIYRAARDKYNDEDAGYLPIPRDPFGRVKVERPACRGQRALDAATIQALIDFKTIDKSERVAVDIFIVSFALMGANMADLWEAAPPRRGVWVYRRRKTRDRRSDGAEMRVQVPECLGPWLERLKAAEGSARWLRLSERWPDKDRATHAVNAALQRVAGQLGVEPFTLYAARKSFATIARRAGVEKATIDECLCHVGDLRMADIYIEKDWTLLTEAQERVLACFSWG